MSDAQRTPLFDLHEKQGGRMVAFAGYSMPVQYPAGIIDEHNHTRSKAGLFDVSHMGQAWLRGPDFETTARALEKLVPGDLLSLEPGQIRYTQLTNEDGGTIDDLMVSRSTLPDLQDHLYLVVNASRKDVDYAHLTAGLDNTVSLQPQPQWALLALQGPSAADVLERHAPGAGNLRFMFGDVFQIRGEDVYISRCGYTGEDGFEITVRDTGAEALAKLLLAEQEVMPAGLGARDSLRLEAGLCLYGHELDEKTSPVEAGIAWSIGKRRRSEGGFAGADRIMRELAEGPSRRLVGLKPEGRAPAREGALINRPDGTQTGIVTSGGFGPTVAGPVAMGYVESADAKPGTPLLLIVRGRELPATVVKLPFVQHNYKR